MLVLSRKKDESIVLDGQIEIQVLKIKGNTVRLGIKAPAHIKVLRGELSVFDIEVEIEKEEDGDSDEDAECKTGAAPLMHLLNRGAILPNPFCRYDKLIC